MKQIIKLRESELKRMISETIRSVVNEIKTVGKIDNFNPSKSYEDKYNILPNSENDKSTNNYNEWQNMAQQLTKKKKKNADAARFRSF